MAQPQLSPPKNTDTPLCCCADLCPQPGGARRSFSPGCRNLSSFLPSEGVARGRRGCSAPGGVGGVSLGAIPWGVRSRGAPWERGGSGAWREPARQSRVLISHRSHATTFCSGCCPTFQSHTSASDFNGLHHSPKLYLTKRGGEMAGGCQKLEQSGPRGLPGHSRILQIAPGSREQRTGFPGVFLGGPSPTGGGAAGVGDSTGLSSSSSTSRSLSSPSFRTRTTPSSEQRASTAAGRAKLSSTFTGICVILCACAAHPPTPRREVTDNTYTHPRQLEDEYGRAGSG